MTLKSKNAQLYMPNKTVLTCEKWLITKVIHVPKCVLKILDFYPPPPTIPIMDHVLREVQLYQIMSNLFIPCQFRSASAPLPSTVMFSTYLTGVVVFLLRTCSNHLIRPSLIFNEMCVTPNLSQNTSFLIRSIL